MLSRPCNPDDIVILINIIVENNIKNLYFSLNNVVKKHTYYCIFSYRAILSPKLPISRMQSKWINKHKPKSSFVLISLQTLAKTYRQSQRKAQQFQEGLIC